MWHRISALTKSSVELALLCVWGTASLKNIEYAYKYSMYVHTVYEIHFLVMRSRSFCSNVLQDFNQSDGMGLGADGSHTEKWVGALRLGWMSERQWWECVVHTHPCLPLGTRWGGEGKWRERERDSMYIQGTEKSTLYIARGWGLGMTFLSKCVFECH